MCVSKCSRVLPILLIQHKGAFQANKGVLSNSIVEGNGS